jgi:hypothetical protein
MTTPRDEAAKTISDWQETRVRNALGQEFRSTSSRVLIRRPGWMPGWFYRRLMRTVVIEEREPVAPRRERRRMKARVR